MPTISITDPEFEREIFLHLTNLLAQDNWEPTSGIDFVKELCARPIRDVGLEAPTQLKPDPKPDTDTDTDTDPTIR